MTDMNFSPTRMVQTIPSSAGSGVDRRISEANPDLKLPVFYISVQMPVNRKADFGAKREAPFSEKERFSGNVRLDY